MSGVIRDDQIANSANFPSADEKAALVGTDGTPATGNKFVTDSDSRLTDARTDADAVHDNVASEISAITAKATPVTGDFLLIEDSAAANIKKSITMGAIDHDALTNFAIGEHRVINDAGTTTTELLSASKILALVAAGGANIDLKDSVETVATANISLTGEQTLNSILTSASRVGVTAQTSGDENGIYTTAAGAWTRTTDADEDAEVTQGMAFYVASGDKVGNQYIITTADPIVVDTTVIVFTEIPRIVLGTTSGTAAAGDDSRIPTQDENDALVGTDGAPATGNPYVTDSDSRNTDSRAPNGSAGGDLTGTYPNPTIAADAVTNAKLADMAANSIKGNNTGGALNPVDLTGTQATAMFDAFTSALKGLAPASGGGTTNFLRADGSWAAPAGADTQNTLTEAYNEGGAGAGRSIAVTDGAFELAQAVETAGSPNIFDVLGAAHTTLAANTEAEDVLFNLARNVQFTAGTGIADQRAVKIQSPTYAATAAETITTAATVSIDGAPTAGTNMTLTKAFALNIESDLTNLADGIELAERAAVVSAPGAAKGGVWVKNDAPSALMFTDDTGTDVNISNPVATLDNAYEEEFTAAGGNETFVLGQTTAANANMLSGRHILGVYRQGQRLRYQGSPSTVFHFGVPANNQVSTIGLTAGDLIHVVYAV